MNARLASPALGIGYGMWLRGRLPLAASFVLVLALAVSARLVPALQLPLAFGAGIHVPCPSVVFLAPLLLVPVLPLLEVFTFGPLDLRTTASPLPLHVRLLPLSTRALVGWPMLFAVVTMASLWLALLGLVLRPAGVMTAILWPTAILVACTLWTQAITWVPCPGRFVRLPLLLVFVGIPLVLASVDPRGGDHFWAFLIAMVLYAAAAWATAMIGLSRARAGAEWPAVAWPSIAARRSPLAVGLPSAGAARRWYETRRNTSFVGGAFVLASLPLIAFSSAGMLFPHASWMATRAPGLFPLPTIFSEAFLCSVPFIFSASMSGYLGRFDFWTRPGLSPFFALRPVSTARLVADKIGSAARVAVSMSVCCLAVAASAYGAWRATGARPLPAVDVMVVVLSYAALLFRNLVVGLWTTMLGRLWPRRLVAVSTAFAFAAAPLIICWVAYDAKIRAAAILLAPFLSGALLAAKLVAAALVARRLRARRLVSPAVVGMCAVLWCLVGVAAVAAVSRYFALSWTVAAFAMCFVPLARVGLAVAALDASRHR
jgi:hypothetical protein